MTKSLEGPLNWIWCHKPSTPTVSEAGLLEMWARPTCLKEKGVETQFRHTKLAQFGKTITSKAPCKY